VMRPRAPQISDSQPDHLRGVIGALDGSGRSRPSRLTWPVPVVQVAEGFTSACRFRRTGDQPGPAHSAVISSVPLMLGPRVTDAGWLGDALGGPRGRRVRPRSESIHSASLTPM
jgi:hypothetical protein